MILVADSGSSKADWIIIKNGDERIEFSTKGINPFFLNEKEICKILSGYNEIQEYIIGVIPVSAGFTDPLFHFGT